MSERRSLWDNLSEAKCWSTYQAWRVWGNREVVREGHRLALDMIAVVIWSLVRCLPAGARGESVVSPCRP